MADKPTRLLIVDDSALYRQTIRNVLRDAPDVSIVGVARAEFRFRRLKVRFDNRHPLLITFDEQLLVQFGIIGFHLIYR